MPGNDGTGPTGQGPIGSGFNGGAGRGGRGGMGGSMAAGPGGYCICPRCGEKITHQPGVMCTGIDCPKCGSRMIRE